jgi:thioester reductase-like protein
MKKKSSQQNLPNMTAKKELEQWVQQHQNLNTVEEKQVFYQKIAAKLDSQTNEQRLAGLLALKNAVSKQRAKIEQLRAQQTSPALRIFPTSEEDRAFLQALFLRMNIPYEVSMP